MNKHLPAQWTNLGNGVAVRVREQGPMLIAELMWRDAQDVLARAMIALDVRAIYRRIVRVAMGALKRIATRRKVDGEFGRELVGRELVGRKKKVRIATATERKAAKAKRKADRKAKRKRASDRFKRTMARAAKAIAKAKIIDKLRKVWRKIVGSKLVSTALKVAGPAIGGAFGGPMGAMLGSSLAGVVTTSAMAEQGQVPKPSTADLYKLGSQCGCPA